MKNSPTFFTFPELKVAAAHLILGAFWKNLYIGNQESIIYNIAVEFC